MSVPGFLNSRMVFEVRLPMKKVGCFSRRPDKPVRSALFARSAACLGIAALTIMAGTAAAQAPTPGAEVPTPAQMSVPDGYTAHHSVDVGGRMTSRSGSDAMYDTLVNLHSGPRVLGENFEMRAQPGKKDLPVDYLKAFGSGFGGDPYNFAKLETSKGKYFDFTGLFRRDRQYFDYDLLGNPNIVPGSSIAIGPSDAPTGSVAWPQQYQSPLLFNTVRRMLDTNLTVMPVSRVTYRFGYSHNTMEGPTLSPSYTIFKYNALLEQYQRNGSDDYVAGIDIKPIDRTSFTVEQHWYHYKNDSYFTLNPKGFLAQEADGTPVYLGNWDSQVPYGIGACNTGSMGSGFTDKTHYTILSPAQTPGGLPVINAACSVVTSYVRTQPTRINIPTSIVRFQSSHLQNVSMNGDFRYTMGKVDLPQYYENATGLNGIVRSQTWQGGFARGHRAVVVADFGIVYQATKTFSLSEQINYSSAQQPGYSYIPAPLTMSTPKTPGNQTITYSGPLTPGTGTLPHGIEGVVVSNYFGQSFLINNLTASWDVTPRTTVSLTYRNSDHKIGQGVPHRGAIPAVLADPVNGTVEILGNGGILDVAWRPLNNWELNGSAELMYQDNAFTPVTPRQMQHYRVHTRFRPKPWATISAAYNDRERHNNTFNNEISVATGDATYYGPIDYVDHSRIVSTSAVLAPTENVSFQMDYAFSDVYQADNVCFADGAAPGLPGTATVNAGGTLNVCPGIYARGSNTILIDQFARSFMDAPTNSGSASLSYKPSEAVQTNIGYRINSVNGSRFFIDARDVNGSLVSNYQTPYASVAWTSRPGLTWKAEYNYYGYGEGGPSGPGLCTQTITTTTTPVACSSLPYPTGVTEPASGLTAPREFRANNITLGIHYEF